MGFQLIYLQYQEKSHNTLFEKTKMARWYRTHIQTNLSSKKLLWTVSFVVKIIAKYNNLVEGIAYQVLMRVCIPGGLGKNLLGESLDLNYPLTPAKIP